MASFKPQRTKRTSRRQRGLEPIVEETPGVVGSAETGSLSRWTLASLPGSFYYFNPFLPLSSLTPFFPHPLPPSSGEATHLSSDFKRIYETYFPHRHTTDTAQRLHGQGCTVSRQLCTHHKCIIIVIPKAAQFFNISGCFGYVFALHVVQIQSC